MVRMQAFGTHFLNSIDWQGECCSGHRENITTLYHTYSRAAKGYMLNGLRRRQVWTKVYSSGGDAPSVKGQYQTLVFWTGWSLNTKKSSSGHYKPGSFNKWCCRLPANHNYYYHYCYSCEPKTRVYMEASYQASRGSLITFTFVLHLTKNGYYRFFFYLIWKT